MRYTISMMKNVTSRGSNDVVNAERAQTNPSMQNTLSSVSDIPPSNDNNIIYDIVTISFPVYFVVKWVYRLRTLLQNISLNLPFLYCVCAVFLSSVWLKYLSLFFDKGKFTPWDTLLYEIFLPLYLEIPGNTNRGSVRDLCYTTHKIIAQVTE